MIAAILGALNPIKHITEAISAARIASLQASTDKDRIEADERIKTLEARKAVLIAESGSKLNMSMRAGFALPFVIYNAKLVLWDKVLGLGTTDPLSPELFQIEIACIGFYFLHDIARMWRRKNG